MAEDRGGAGNDTGAGDDGTDLSRVVSKVSGVGPGRTYPQGKVPASVCRALDVEPGDRLVFRQPDGAGGAIVVEAWPGGSGDVTDAAGGEGN